MDRLDQLFARSAREIEAHSPILGETEAGQQLLRGSRRSCSPGCDCGRRISTGRIEQSEICSRDVDTGELHAVAQELRSGYTPGAEVAGQFIVTITDKPAAELAIIASCAVAAL